MDALEVMFAERVQLEAILQRTGPISTVDDLATLEQYLVGLTNTNMVPIVCILLTRNRWQDRRWHD